MQLPALSQPRDPHLSAPKWRCSPCRIKIVCVYAVRERVCVCLSVCVWVSRSVSVSVCISTCACDWVWVCVYPHVPNLAWSYFRGTLFRSSNTTTIITITERSNIHGRTGNITVARLCPTNETTVTIFEMRFQRWLRCKRRHGKKPLARCESIPFVSV